MTDPPRPSEEPMNAEILRGDCLEIMATMPAESVDAIVTDPPYGLGFMGKKWDALPPGQDWAEECLRVLKPGGHLLAFGGTRTYHRLAVAVEDAGFEIRDCLAWLYGSGFPKSHDVSKAIDKAAGAEGTYGAPKSAAHAGWIDRGAMRGEDGHDGYQRPWMKDGEAVDRNARKYEPATPEAQKWQGYGTALKPAHEPIVLARKPFKGTVAANVLEHGTGALNIDGCRVEGAKPHREVVKSQTNEWDGGGAWKSSGHGNGMSTEGRWPANIMLDPDAAAMLDEQSGELKSPGQYQKTQAGFRPDYVGGGENYTEVQSREFGDKGGASRFFYVAKASRKERNAGLDDRNQHPTVKPINLMRWLARLITPPGGTVLDPFVGSGTTGIAAGLEGFKFIGIEREEEYADLAEARIEHWSENE